MRAMRWLALVVMLVCCGRPEEDPEKCADLSGQWTATYQDKCSVERTGDVVINQNGCAFSAVLAGQGTVEGTVKPDTIAYTIDFFPCDGTADGRGEIVDGEVRGVFAGSAHGLHCCEEAIGSFTLRR